MTFSLAKDFIAGIAIKQAQNLERTASANLVHQHYQKKRVASPGPRRVFHSSQRLRVTW
jgi:hypothetical protein